MPIRRRKPPIKRQRLKIGDAVELGVALSEAQGGDIVIGKRHSEPLHERGDPRQPQATTKFESLDFVSNSQRKISPRFANIAFAIIRDAGQMSAQ